MTAPPQIYTFSILDRSQVQCPVGGRREGQALGEPDCIPPVFSPPLLGSVSSSSWCDSASRLRLARPLAPGNICGSLRL